MAVEIREEIMNEMRDKGDIENILDAEEKTGDGREEEDEEEEEADDGNQKKPVASMLGIDINEIII